MKRAIFFFVYLALILLGGTDALAQRKGLDGTYWYGYDRLVIDGEKCYYIPSFDVTSVEVKDTLAIFLVRDAFKGWKRLISMPMWYGVQYRQKTDPLLKDSIRVSLEFPNYSGSGIGVNVSVVGDYFSKDLEYTKGIKFFYIPAKSSSMMFTVVASDTASVPVGWAGEYYGMNFASSYFFKIERGSNDLHFVFPAVDNGFLNRYYIDWEYIRIKRNTIIWRSQSFVREE